MSLQRQVVCLTVAAGVHVFSSRESLHCFLVGWCTNKSYPVSLQRQVVCLTVAAGNHVFSSGESLHCFLVGWYTNKSYVIATSDL